MKTVRILAVLGAFYWYGLDTSAEPALTIYNQDFAVVRESVPLDLKQGTNELRFTDITAHLEPDSVVLRDPSGKRALQILEQNYRSDPVSQELLLSLYEGKTLDFLMYNQEGAQYTITGKIIRSGYVPHQAGLQRYGQQYYQTQSARAWGPSGQPVIEVDGKVRFGLPGTPVFPALTDEAILKPTLHWIIETNEAGPLDAELSYVTGGMSWQSDYNFMAPEQGDVLDVIGWVTLDNQSGRTFENAHVKLMAGDVRKLTPEQRGDMNAALEAAGYMRSDMRPPVTEKAFDEYHLYTLERPTTVRDRETKQVEFLRAANVQAQRFYVYDGVKIDPNRYQGWSGENIRQDQNYGTECNRKIWVLLEFANTDKNGLGIPLPRGRTRFYRRDTDGRLEFTGENLIDHTPKDETARVNTGNAFDLVGERRRTQFTISHDQRMLDEAFEIKLRNHKKEPVEIRVVEHLYRGINWAITTSSHPYQKTDSQTIEFRVQTPPDGEVSVTYIVHYTW
ncbi:MAG: hypothetical protein HY706_05965 [Candidatus Hydrogenedentes bacterium]|nr:hypothetical protein [Candidatus Hydrogenedentota bacterium]